MQYDIALNKTTSELAFDTSKFSNDSRMILKAFCKFRQPQISLEREVMSRHLEEDLMAPEQILAMSEEQRAEYKLINRDIKNHRSRLPELCDSLCEKQSEMVIGRGAASDVEAIEKEIDMLDGEVANLKVQLANIFRLDSKEDLPHPELEKSLSELERLVAEKMKPPPVNAAVELRQIHGIQQTSGLIPRIPAQVA